MKLIVIAVAYERPINLRILCDCFLVQTNPNWELHIIHDGMASSEVKQVCRDREDPRIHFKETSVRVGQYGHPNRKMMLERVKADPDDFILITNDDNYYVPKFVEYMLGSVNPAIGIVYCDTLHSYIHYNVHQSKLLEEGIDMGAFIVRQDVAKEVGFQHAHFSADGAYAEECAKHCRDKELNFTYIPIALFVHN